MHETYPVLSFTIKIRMRLRILFQSWCGSLNSMCDIAWSPVCCERPHPTRSDSIFSLPSPSLPLLSFTEHDEVICSFTHVFFLNHSCGWMLENDVTIAPSFQIKNSSFHSASVDLHYRSVVDCLGCSQWSQHLSRQGFRGTDVEKCHWLNLTQVYKQLAGTFAEAWIKDKTGHETCSDVGSHCLCDRLLKGRVCAAHSQIPSRCL